MNDLVIFRGAGDVATGSIQKLYRTGFRLLLLERETPLCIRRNVALAQAMIEGEWTVEDVTARKVTNIEEIEKCWDENVVPIIADEDGYYIKKLKPLAVIDGILAKKNYGTNKNMAPITIGLGPGFCAGKDCDVVIETNRGHNLGRLIFEGEPEADTKNPGNIEGFTTERILRASDDGNIKVLKDIGSFVEKGETVAMVGDLPIKAALDGMVRGMINDGFYVKKGLKIGDVDPRRVLRNAKTISDKARLIGGGCLEAVLILRRRLYNGERNS